MVPQRALGRLGSRARNNKGLDVFRIPHSDGEHDRVGNVGMRMEDVFQLIQFDAQPPDFDLMIAAAEELNRSIGPVSTQVAGAITADAVS